MNNQEEQWLCPRCGFTIETSDIGMLPQAIRLHDALAVHDDEIPRA